MLPNFFRQGIARVRHKGMMLGRQNSQHNLWPVRMAERGMMLGYEKSAPPKVNMMLTTHTCSAGVLRYYVIIIRGNRWEQCDAQNPYGMRGHISLKRYRGKSPLAKRTLLASGFGKWDLAPGLWQVGSGLSINTKHSFLDRTSSCPWHHM